MHLVYIVSCDVVFNTLPGILVTGISNDHENIWQAAGLTYLDDYCH